CTVILILVTQALNINIPESRISNTAGSVLMMNPNAYGRIIDGRIFKAHILLILPNTLSDFKSITVSPGKKIPEKNVLLFQGRSRPGAANIGLLIPCLRRKRIVEPYADGTLHQNIL